MAYHPIPPVEPLAPIALPPAAPVNPAHHAVSKQFVLCDSGILLI
jgi:hypothetical protein